MKQHVVLEVGLFAESAATHVALVRPRAAVHVHVALEVAGRRKRLGAQRTFVWLLLEHARSHRQSYHSTFTLRLLDIHATNITQRTS